MASDCDRTVPSFPDERRHQPLRVDRQEIGLPVLPVPEDGVATFVVFDPLEGKPRCVTRRRWRNES